jgi:DNA-binding response OmpR family regulator
MAEDPSLNGVLVVDDDVACLTEIEGWLEREGIECVGVDTFQAALGRLATSRERFRLCVLDLRLGCEVDGLSLGQYVRQVYGLHFVLISAFLDTPITVQAMRTGALDVLDKPLSAERLMFAVRRIVSGSDLQTTLTARSDRPALSASGAPTAPQRWAHIMLEAARSMCDVRTLSAVEHRGAMSDTSFRSLCRRCSVSPKKSRDFSRIVRAVAISMRDHSAVSDHFDVTDQRTVVKLCRAAGVSPGVPATSLRRFILDQKLIPQHCECLREFGHFAANDALFL